jgi:cephalosporin hydroxylase
MITKTLFYNPLGYEIQDESHEIIQILEENGINSWDMYSGTDKATHHSFTGAYEFLLQPYRNKDINLLEIGVSYGGSALLWHEYLSGSKLALVDSVNKIHPHTLQKLRPDRYKFYNQDAYNQETISRIREDFSDGFDVAIEDGPHNIETQLFFLENYLPLMKEGGVMVIEDIQHQEHINLLYASLSEERRDRARVIDLRAVKGKWDDLMFVLYT